MYESNTPHAFRVCDVIKIWIIRPDSDAFRGDELVQIMINQNQDLNYFSIYANNQD